MSVISYLISFRINSVTLVVVFPNIRSDQCEGEENLSNIKNRGSPSSWDHCLPHLLTPARAVDGFIFPPCRCINHKYIVYCPIPSMIRKN